MIISSTQGDALNRQDQRSRIQDALDFDGALTDSYVLSWNSTLGKFVLVAQSGGGGTLDHGLDLTGLGDDDHTQYLLATGARAGASAGAQTFTNGIVGPTWKPASDSTTALQLQTAGGTAVMTVDTTNKRIGVGTTAPSSIFSVQASGAVAAFSLSGSTTNVLGAILSPTMLLAANGYAIYSEPILAPSTNINSAYAYLTIARAASSSSNINNLYGFFIANRSSASYSGVLGSSYSVYVSSPTWDGSAPTNQYGVFVGNQSGATNNYGIYTNAGNIRLMSSGSDKFGLHGATPVAQQTVTGSRSGNAALADLLTKLANVGLIVDGTSA